MPKTSTRKKSTATWNGQHVAMAPDKNAGSPNGTSVGRQAGALAQPSTGATGMVGLLMPAMVALGCWGMAFTFAVFSTDSNHLLFGGMAALMAIMWSVSFGIRVRKVLRQK